MTKTIETITYSDNEQLINRLTEILGEDGSFTLAVRGIYKEEIGKKTLRKSFEWDGREWEVKGKQLSGTSAIEIVPVWGEAGYREIEKGLIKALNLVEKYGTEEVLAIVKGNPNYDEIIDDIGEVVLSKCQVVAYIKRV